MEYVSMTRFRFYPKPYQGSRDTMQPGNGCKTTQMLDVGF